MVQVNPLERFSVITTNRTEEAEAAISRSLTDIKIISVADRSRFQLQMNAVNFGRTSLVFNRYQVRTEINSGLNDDSVFFLIGGRTPTTVDLVNGSVVVSPQKAALITPSKNMLIKRSEGSEIFALRTSLPDLLHTFEAITARHHRGTLIFDHYVDLTQGPGAMLKRMVKYVVNELDQNDQIAKNPGLFKSYDDMLLTALLSLPHNQRQKLYPDHRNPIAPGIVHRAEEYMRAYLNETISIIDLLGVCDCSRSALFAAFQNSRGYTPMEFLTEQRLQSARRKLLKSPPEASISSIALNCGFTHFGRFSQVYRKRFGKRPSDTLRKGK
jgi:AraC-like DNA-binding protein